MVTDDIFSFPLPIGAHAQALRLSRMQALKEYGINPATIDTTHTPLPTAQLARYEREQILNGYNDAHSI